LVGSDELVGYEGEIDLDQLNVCMLGPNQRRVPSIAVVSLSVVESAVLAILWFLSCVEALAFQGLRESERMKESELILLQKKEKRWNQLSGNASKSSESSIKKK
jgi:hypothetical protein